MQSMEQCIEASFCFSSTENLSLRRRRLSLVFKSSLQREPEVVTESKDALEFWHLDICLAVLMLVHREPACPPHDSNSLFQNIWTLFDTLYCTKTLQRRRKAKGNAGKRDWIELMRSLRYSTEVTSYEVHLIFIRRNIHLGLWGDREIRYTMEQ